MMRELEGGCSVPMGVNSRFVDGALELKGVVLSLDGTSRVAEQV
jgi:hydroxymethylbilane synthase